MMKSRTTMFLMASLLLTAISQSACRPPAEATARSQTRPPGKHDATRSTPAAVARRLHQLFLDRNFDAMRPLIVKEHRDQAIELLRAMGEVVTANRELGGVVDAAYRLPISDTWDLAFIEDNLGLFSSRVKLINQKYKGDTAVVTLQEGENVPLIHARFELHDGAWLYRPELAPAATIPELYSLANVLRDVAGMVRAGAEYEAYIAAFFTRAVPQIRRVLTVAPDANAVASGEAVD